MALTNPGEIKYTLVADGPSDRALMPVIDWALRQICTGLAIQSEWADIGRFPNRPGNLSEKIKLAIEYFPCDLLVVHRDAEREALSSRLDEINRALGTISEEVTLPLVVRIVPMRMQEAWLLFDEVAIRMASGNRNGRMPLNLPQLSRVEGLPNPKAELYRALRIASGLSGRRLDRFPDSLYAQRVPSYVDNFGPLMTLSAFSSFYNEALAILQTEV